METSWDAFGVLAVSGVFTCCFVILPLTLALLSPMCA